MSDYDFGQQHPSKNSAWKDYYNNLSLGNFVGYALKGVAIWYLAKSGSFLWDSLQNPNSIDAMIEHIGTLVHLGSVFGFTGFLGACAHGLQRSGDIERYNKDNPKKEIYSFLGPLFSLGIPDLGRKTPRFRFSAPSMS